MGFISLVMIWMLWPLFLIMAVLALVLPILGVALNVATVIILILNILFFLLLILLRKGWKQAGKLDKMYIESYGGFRRFALRAIRIMFTLGLLWEVLIIVLCIVLLVFQPMGALTDRPAF